jgi:hypothetical protein
VEILSNAGSGFHFTKEFCFVVIGSRSLIAQRLTGTTFSDLIGGARSHALRFEFAERTRWAEAARQQLAVATLCIALGIPCYRWDCTFNAYSIPATSLN